MTDNDTKYIRETLDEIREILVGNGDPEKGLVVRFTRLSDSVKNCQNLSADWRHKHERDAAIQHDLKVAAGRDCFSRKTALLCGGFSFLTAIIVVALNHWLK